MGDSLVVEGKVLVLEDLPHPRMWLCGLVQQAWPQAEVVEAVSLQTAWECLRSQTFQVALVDWELPDGHAGPLIAHLRDAVPQTTVIVSTIHDDDDRVFAALRAGASGYVLKSQPSQKVLEQLEAIERGEPALTPSIAHKVLAYFRTATSTRPDQPAPASNGASSETVPALSPREVDALRLIAKGYRTAEAAELMGITAHTLGGYITSVYRKLGISCRAEATLEASRLGLVG